MRGVYHICEVLYERVGISMYSVYGGAKWSIISPLAGRPLQFNPGNYNRSYHFKHIIVPTDDDFRLLISLHLSCHIQPVQVLKR